MEVSISNTSLNTFNQSIDEIIKKYFEGYSVAEALKITKENIDTTTGDLSNQDKAEITYAAMQKRKWARKRGDRHFKK